MVSSSFPRFVVRRAPRRRRPLRCSFDVMVAKAGGAGVLLVDTIFVILIATNMLATNMLASTYVGICFHILPST